MITAAIDERPAGAGRDRAPGPKPTHSAGIRLGCALADTEIAEIRRTMELHHHKWDAQVGDIEALAPFPLILDVAEWQRLSNDAERLYEELLAMEREILERPDLQRRVGVPRALRAAFRGGAPTPSAARVMRFDFHFTPHGWRVSEVNSDVPGGFTEASAFAELVAASFPGLHTTGNPTRRLAEAIAARSESGPVALTCAPGHMEDLQIVAHLASALERLGCATSVVSPSQLTWIGGCATLGARSERVGSLFRFYQADWLAKLPARAGWRWMFAGGKTPVCNPGISALGETKRLPLVWDDLGVAIPTWRRLLPETRALHEAPWETSDDWLIKAAYGNNGETVIVRESMSRGQWTARRWAARFDPGAWVAQRRFEVVPLLDGDAVLRPCVGVYVIDGSVAGAYGRVSDGLVIDYRAREAAVLIEATR